MLEFFRKVASSIPAESSPPPSQDGDALPIEPLGGAGRDDSSKRAGIIVLREDLDFYVIPPKADIQQPEMIEVKRAAARALLKQDGIFSGLKRSDEPGTTEAHLIEMLTAGYVFLWSLCRFFHTRALLWQHSPTDMVVIVDLIMTTNGDTEQASLTRPSSAVWL